LREELQQKGLWPADKLKPSNPKETLEAIVRNNNIRRSSAMYGKIAHNVSVNRCEDPEFKRLIAQLRAWFPA
jgi:hypothetical protein